MQSKVSFQNNRQGTLYNPDTEGEKEWGSEISSRISGILKSEVKGVGRDNRFAKKRPNLPEQIRKNQESFWKEEEDKRRQNKEDQYTPYPQLITQFRLL